MVDNVQVNGSFHTSDYKLLSFNLNIAKEAEDSTEIRHDYINDAQEEFRLIEWDKVMIGTANENWEQLKASREVKKAKFNFERKLAENIKKD